MSCVKLITVLRPIKKCYVAWMMQKIN